MMLRPLQDAAEGGKRSTAVFWGGCTGISLGQTRLSLDKKIKINGCIPRKAIVFRGIFVYFPLSTKEVGVRTLGAFTVMFSTFFKKAVQLSGFDNRTYRKNAAQ